MDNEGISFAKRVKYVKRLLYSIKPKIPQPGSDLEEIKRENERHIHTLREYILPMITDLEQSRAINTYRILGLPENPKVNTITNIINYFKFNLGIESKPEDYGGCYICEGAARKIVVNIKNSGIRRKVWGSRPKANSQGVLICEELCRERARVRQKAIENFHKINVSVNKGVIYVKMRDGTTRELRTDVQYEKLLQEKLFKHINISS